MKKIEILVCAHKQDENIRNGGVYRAIQAGKADRKSTRLNSSH